MRAYKEKHILIFRLVAAVCVTFFGATWFAMELVRYMINEEPAGAKQLRFVLAVGFIVSTFFGIQLVREYRKEISSKE